MRDTINHAEVGDEIVIPIDERGRTRRAIIAAIEPDGVTILWYKPRGEGPFLLKMPHVGLCPVFYAPEAAGMHKSHWKKTDDEKIADFNRIERELKRYE